MMKSRYWLTFMQNGVDLVKLMAPEIKKFADTHKEVRVLKVDIDKNSATAEQFNIQGVPTLILFKKGKVLWRQSGAMNAQQLSAIVKGKL